MDINTASKIWVNRILENVHKTEKGCWEHRVSHFRLMGKDTYISRFLFEQFKREIPVGMKIYRRCDNKQCCNPAHFTTSERTVEKEKIKTLVDKKISTYEMARILGCSQHAIMNWMKELGLKSKFKRKFNHGRPKTCRNCGKIVHNKYCNSKCRSDFYYKQNIDKWLRKEISGNTTKDMQLLNCVRKWVLERSGNKCEKCGWSKINPITHRCPLTVHHKDGNSQNTVPENLEAICPNCHSLTDNYGGLNRGKGRKARYHRINHL